MLSQITSLPLQEQNTVKTALGSVVPNIEAAVAAASKVEWNRTSSQNGRADNTTGRSQDESKILRNPSPVPSAGSPGLPSPQYASTTEKRRSCSVTPDQNIDMQSENLNKVSLDTSECSMYAIMADETEDSDAKPIDITSSLDAQSPSSRLSFVSPPPVPVRSSMGYSEATTQEETAAVESPNSTKQKSLSPSVSVHTPRSIRDTKDIVWMLRVLSSSDFTFNGDERMEAIAELKTLIKQGTDAFWSRNYSQVSIYYLWFSFCF